MGIRSRTVTYPRFLWMLARRATDGTPLFYAAMTVLTAIALVGANTWAHQMASGMGVTGMTDHVSWGLYIANFTFGVGLAAGAVMMVIPAYLYRNREMHDVVIVGEILAIAAIVICILFVVVDMGRPDRFWHVIPGIGRFNWPISMLTWDIIVLNGYLLINLHVCGYLIFNRYRGQRPRKRWYLPFVLLSIFWAISIHSVTAFLYCGLGGRPFWNSALLAPRFLASAFVTGPSFVIIVLQLMRRIGGVHMGLAPVRTLASILRITVLVSLFMFLSELFTAFYTGGHHAVAARYLFLGLDGKHALVPWIWTGFAFDVTAAVLLQISRIHPHRIRWLNIACVLAFFGAWIEKGMGLIIPGFVPSTLGEIVEYRPSLAEWKITAGIWAFGVMVLLVGIKAAMPVLTGHLSARAKRGDSHSSGPVRTPSTSTH